MKTLYNLLLLLILHPAFAANHSGNLERVTKQKTIKKTYLVNSDAGIDIQNSYGSVNVTTWNEDKIELDITIKVSGESEKWVTSKLNDIDVNIEALKKMITAKTNISNTKNFSRGRDKDFEINYEIKIPKNGSVKINNKYGDITTSDLFANVDIAGKYGKLTLGKLSGTLNAINIEYTSKSSIEFIKSGSINADYSGITISAFENLNLMSDYSDTVLGNGDELNYNGSYGKLECGKVSSLQGTGNYLTIKIKEINRMLVFNTKYSKLNIDSIAASAKNLAINSDYTSVNIGYNAGYAFDYDIQLKNANLKYSSNLEMKVKEENSTSKNYQGFYKKSGENKISINSNYGNVALTPNP